MSTTTSASPTTVTTRAPIVVPESTGGSAHLRAIKVVCHRELLRLKADRTRVISSLVQPFLFLFVLGTGLGSVVSATGGLNYKTFIFPGVLAMSVQFTAMFSAMSIVWDREFGFLREMLVAPVPRSAIIIGKALGGALQATAQGVVILALAGFVGVPYNPVMMVALVLQLFVLSFAICAFGLVAAARIRQIQAFMAIMNLLIMPLFFLSGAMYPLTNLPSWMQLIARFNPLTYAVAAMRHTVFSHLDLTDAVRHSLDPGVTWFGWVVPAWLAVVVVGGLALLLLSIAVAQFQKAE
jgi:ABC-2 type transport system permease protein